MKKVCGNNRKGRLGSLGVGKKKQAEIVHPVQRGKEKERREKRKKSREKETTYDD